MDEEQTYDPFWHGGAAALLLTALAVAMFLFILQPAREDSRRMAQKTAIAENRLKKKQEQLRALREKCHELEIGDPETIKESIRQELLKGKKNEFVL